MHISFCCFFSKRTLTICVSILIAGASISKGVATKNVCDSTNKTQPHHCLRPRMSFSLLSMTSFLFLMDLAALDFLSRRHRIFPKDFVDLTIIGNSLQEIRNFTKIILAKLHLGLCRRVDYVCLRLSQPWKKKTICFEASYFHYSNSIFHLLFPPLSYFFTIIRRTPIRFRPYPSNK